MLSTLRANSVMQGSIDYFCLACEALLKSDTDVDLHIVLPTHVTSLQQTKYVESCVEDRVREVNKRYYCEFCNILLPYKNKVNLHIKEEKHKFNKTEGGVQKKPPVFLKWVDDAVVAFDDVLISSEAWQGFIDEDSSCIVCEKEISDPEGHRVETDHVIRLMQAKVQGGNDNIYRKIDDTTFQCLTCNVVITSSEIVTHFDTAPHLKLYIERQKAQRALEKSLAAQKSDTNKIPENTSSAKPEEVSGKNQKAGKKDQEATKKGQETAKKEEVSKKEVVAPKKEIVVPKKETVVPKKETVVPKKETEVPKKDTPTQKKEQETPVNKVQLKKSPAPKKEPINVCKALGIKDYINMDSDNSGNMCNCILCGWTIERSGVPRHVNGQHHQTILKLQEEREKKLRKKRIEESQEEVEELDQLEEESEKEADTEVDKEKSKIIDSIIHFQKNHVLIDLITEKAFCTKCSLTLSYSFEIIEKHIINHDKKTETGEKYPKLSECHVKTDVKKEKKEDKSVEYEQAKRFAAANELTYNRDNSKAFCRICELKVPSSLRSMEEHVNGMGHQTKKNPEVPKEKTEKLAPEEKEYEYEYEMQEIKVKKVQEDPEFKTVASDDFCEEVTTFQNFYQHLAIINSKFCISILSFMMITKNGDRMQCQVCDCGVTMSNINDHIKTRRHEQNMKDAPVLSGLADEFVREVRPGAYHCGFCCLVVGGRAALRLHLASDAHRRARTQAEWALEEHLPSIEEHRLERQRRMEFILLMRLLNF